MINRIRFSPWLALGIALAMPFGHAHAGGQMSGFALSTCHSDGARCLKAEAEKADSGHFKPIFALKAVQVTTLNRATGEKKVSVSERGFMDFESNRLILNTENGDKVFNLNDFSVDEWKLK